MRPFLFPQHPESVTELASCLNLSQLTLSGERNIDLFHIEENQQIDTKFKPHVLYAPGQLQS